MTPITNEWVAIVKVCAEMNSYLKPGQLSTKLIVRTGRRCGKQLETSPYSWMHLSNDARDVVAAAITTLEVDRGLLGGDGGSDSHGGVRVHCSVG